MEILWNFYGEMTDNIIDQKIGGNCKERELLASYNVGCEYFTLFIDCLKILKTGTF